MSMRATSRSMLKAQYTRFTEAWSNEKRYQQYSLDNLDASIQISEQKNPDGTYVKQIVDAKGEDVKNLLGRKPTFAMWLQAVKNKKIAADVHKQLPVEEKADPKKVQVEETDWE